MVKVYLPETNEEQFLIWLNGYCRQKSVREIVYKFSDGWSFELYYPILGAQTSVSFTARIFRAVHQEARETTETMANNIEAIKLEWRRMGDGLMVTIWHHDGSWVMPPLNDLLTDIRTSWPKAISDNWT
jgi:hypothetical protein